MFYLRLLSVYLFLYILSPTGFAAECTGREGVYSPPEWAVTWSKPTSSIEGEKEIWRVEQSLGTRSISGQVEVERLGSSFFAKKSGMSDRNNCIYTGTISGNNSVQGTYQCPNFGGEFTFRLNCTW